MTAGRNNSPLNTEKTTEFMPTPTTSVSTTPSDSDGVRRMTEDRSGRLEATSSLVSLVLLIFPPR